MTWGDKILNILTHEFKVGSIQLSLVTVGEFLVLVGIVFLLARVVRKTLLSRVLSRTGMGVALQQVVSRFASYLVIFVGLLVSFQVVGINLGSLAFLAGAFGLGLGFGLQNIISNFVSGLIILAERPIIVGDRIDVGGLQGNVVEINARSTKIVTNENITIIVPNSEFISQQVINWSHGGSKVRFSVPVRVAYGTDPQLVKRALLEVAAESPEVLQDPPPSVAFRAFAESSLNFDLLVWNETHVHRKGGLISEINFRISEKFKQLRIEIPFPQREIHIKSSGVGEIASVPPTG